MGVLVVRTELNHLLLEMQFYLIGEKEKTQNTRIFQGLTLEWSFHLLILLQRYLKGTLAPFLAQYPLKHHQMPILVNFKAETHPVYHDRIILTNSDEAPLIPHSFGLMLT